MWIFRVVNRKSSSKSTSQMQMSILSCTLSYTVFHLAHSYLLKPCIISHSHACLFHFTLFSFVHYFLKSVVLHSLLPFYFHMPNYAFIYQRSSNPAFYFEIYFQAYSPQVLAYTPFYFMVYVVVALRKHKAIYLFFHLSFKFKLTLTLSNSNFIQASTSNFVTLSKNMLSISIKMPSSHARKFFQIPRLYA